MLERLTALAPPPAKPRHRGTAPRRGNVEASLRTVLPADYKRFVDTYGSECFNDYFYVFSPFAEADGMNLIWQAGVPGCFEKDDDLGRAYHPGSFLERYQALMVDDPVSHPHPTYPDRGGLLPVGGDTNGGSMYWLTEGDPDNWPLIRCPRGPFEPPEQYSVGLVEFLVGWLSGSRADCFGGVGKLFLNRTVPVFESP